MTIEPSDHFDLIVGDAFVNVNQEFFGQIFAIIDPAIVVQELLFGHAIPERHMQSMMAHRSYGAGYRLMLQHRIVRIGVQHDDSVRQDIGDIGRDECARIANTITFGELFHHAIDDL